MLDGQPVSDIFVSFQPTSDTTADSSQSPGSYGTTESDGRYELEWSDGSGAVPGEHTVVLVYRDPSQIKRKETSSAGSEKSAGFKLPPRARDGSIEFDVPEDGTEEANFEFQSSEMRLPTATRSRKF